MLSTQMPFAGSAPKRTLAVLAHSSPYDPDRWQRLLPEPGMWPGELAVTPVRGERWPRVSRDQVFSIGIRAHTPEGAVHTLVAASVWGTGTSAQRVARQIKVFTETSAGFGEPLARAVETLRSRGPRAAYEVLHGRGNLIKGLGPAFGTKVMYFAGYGRSHGSEQPLILDSNVALAINRICATDWATTQGGWSIDQYDQYLDLAHRWAREWNSEPDIVERVLFEIGRAPRLLSEALLLHQDD